MQEAEGPPPISHEEEDGKRARGRSFYASAVSEAEQIRLPEALDVEGLDQEIALLRVLVNRLMEDPDNTKILFKGMELLVKAVTAKYRLSNQSKEDLSEAIAGVFKHIGGAMGLEGFGGS